MIYKLLKVIIKWENLTEHELTYVQVFFNPIIIQQQNHH